MINNIFVSHSFKYFFFNNNHILKKPCSLLFPTENNLLFTNSGMIQFISLYISSSIFIKKKIITIQPCLRLGGKHNDLDSIGYTKFHLTFFHMCGNFSFGSYYKNQSVLLVWFYLIFFLCLNKRHFFVSVHINDQQNIYILLEKAQITLHNIILLGKNDNFWSSGNSGPCGSSFEIFYSTGFLFFGKNFIFFFELWNVVFVKYNIIFCQNSVKLNKFLIDTGSGLERLSLVLQKRTSVFDINSFYFIVSYRIFVSYSNNFISNIATRIISDHIRSICVLVEENIVTSNIGRGYILRRLIRRAFLFNRKLNNIFKIIYLCIDIHITYQKQKVKFNYYLFVTQQLQIEKQKFMQTLSIGIKKFLSYLKQSTNKFITNNIGFFFYDTYGFPIDILKDLAHEQQFLVLFKRPFKNHICFNKLKQDKKSNKIITEENILRFQGYKNYLVFSSIQCLYNSQHKTVQLLREGEQGSLILLNTSLYPESGGQKSDIGYIRSIFGLFVTTDIKFFDNKFILHYGIVKYGVVNQYDFVTCTHNLIYRKNISCNHSLAHLVFFYLCRLDKTVKQLSSLITISKIRLDFCYNVENPLKSFMLTDLIFNIGIFEKQRDKLFFFGNIRLCFFLPSFSSNIKNHTTVVKLFTIQKFSEELCCGTHILYIPIARSVRITSLEFVGFKTLRLEILTNNYAERFVLKSNILIKQLCILLRTKNYFLINEIQIKIKILNIYKKNIGNLKRLWVYIREKKFFQSFLDFSIIIFIYKTLVFEPKDILNFYPKYISLQCILNNSRIIISQFFKTYYFLFHNSKIEKYLSFFFLINSTKRGVFYYTPANSNLFKKNVFFIYDFVFDFFCINIFFINYVL